MGMKLPCKVGTVGEAHALGDVGHFRIRFFQKQAGGFLQTEPRPPGPEVHAHPFPEIVMKGDRVRLQVRRRFSERPAGFPPPAPLQPAGQGRFQCRHPFLEAHDRFRRVDRRCFSLLFEKTPEAPHQILHTALWTASGRPPCAKIEKTFHSPQIIFYI